MDRHYSLGIYDYDREKICDLYDSQVDLNGQAFNIIVTEDSDGCHTLTFDLPYMLDRKVYSYADMADVYGTAIFGYSKFGLKDTSRVSNRNFRWDFLESEFLIRYSNGDKNTWFVANKPQRAKSSKKIIGSATCAGYESLLKTRNIYLVLDDTNGIGTVAYLMPKILAGTGWTFDSAHSDIFYEKDGVTEKIRTLKSDGKKGALDLINSLCSLFQGRPVYDTDNLTVAIKAMNNRVQVLEGEVGRNLSAMTVKHDSTNICTRVYIEGEYGDYGYVGIDDVLVDANGDPDETGEPWGLPFLLNFDYYKQIGVFKTSHQTALDTYLHDIREKKAEIREAAGDLILSEDAINNMIGICKLAIFYVSQGLETPTYVYGDLTASQKVLHSGEKVAILRYVNGVYTHEYKTWSSDPDLLIGAYGVAKFVTPSAGKIGVMETQIEAKEKEIARLQRKIETLVNPSTIAEYESQILALRTQIQAIYTGTPATATEEAVVGLYELMADVMKQDGMFYDYTTLTEEVDTLNGEQDDIEADFIAAMGFMLRDGYWSNQNYTVGQEVLLYQDARDMTAEMSKPATDYTLSYVRVTEDFDIAPDDIEINAIFKIYDRELMVDDKLYIKKITYGVDKKENGSIEVSNQDITLTGNDLGSLLSRMAQLADLIDQKNALYDRAKALSSTGTLYTDRLNGELDVMKTKIMSSVSNWYTDSSGNMVFVSADDSSAMMLSGAGLMLSNSKDEYGEWEWRAAMDGKGLTADEIVAGFLSANRIEAGSITTNHLNSEVGATLDISSNTSLNFKIQSIADEAAARAVAQVTLTDSEFTTIFNRTVKDSIFGANNSESIEDALGELNQYKTDVSVYMRFDNTGTLELGNRGDNFKTQITNQKMSFLEGDSEVAYISNSSMFITNARVTETLSIGDEENGYFDWTVTQTGLGLKWRNT